MSSDRLSQQIAFLAEADKLKRILRRTPLTDNSRRENSAEHSWHLTLAAMVLDEYAPPSIDRARVLRLLVVHDLVEIDAGDTFAYDTHGHASKSEREQSAAVRLFGLLPDDQRDAVHALWREFEANATDEARVANALDRLQALVQNMHAGGGSWADHHITRTQVLTRMAPIQTALPRVWPFVLEVIDEFCRRGAIA